MKVTRKTVDQLIIADIPWLIGIFISLLILVFVGIGLSIVIDGELMGFFFVAIGSLVGGICFVAFVRRTQVILNRTTDKITIRQRSVFGFRENFYVLSELDRAELEDTTDSDGDTMYRPTLVFSSHGSSKRTPIVSSYTNTSGPGRIVDAINDWLENPAA